LSHKGRSVVLAPRRGASNWPAVERSDTAGASGDMVAPRRGARTVSSATGGIASLNHRLIALAPSAHTVQV